MHHAVIQSGHQQLRVPATMPKTDSVGERWYWFAVVVGRMFLVIRVAAAGALGYHDHLPSMLEDRVDSATVLLVVGVIWPTEVAVAPARRGERAPPRLVVPGS